MIVSSTDTKPDAAGAENVSALQVVAPVVLTDNAAANVRELLEAQTQQGLSLRVAVQSGGCSGLQYQLFFDDQTRPGDLTLTVAGVPVVIDQMSVPHLHGSTIDYADTPEKQGFTIDNPNATSGGCACGGGSCGC